MRIVMVSDGLIREVSQTQGMQCLKLGTASLEGEVVKKPKKSKK
jgi:hypothetical protein